MYVLSYPKIVQKVRPFFNFFFAFEPLNMTSLVLESLCGSQSQIICPKTGRTFRLFKRCDHSYPKFFKRCDQLFSIFYPQPNKWIIKCIHRNIKVAYNNFICELPTNYWQKRKHQQKTLNWKGKTCVPHPA